MARTAIKGFNGVCYGASLVVSAADAVADEVTGSFANGSNPLPYPLAFYVGVVRPVAATSGIGTLEIGADPITGLETGETYGVSITIDGGDAVEIAVSTEAGTTIAGSAIVSAIEAAIGNTGTVAIDGTEITITSATTGASSTVLIEAGTEADNDLLSELGISAGVPVDGVDAYSYNLPLSDAVLKFNEEVSVNGDFSIADGAATFVVTEGDIISIVAFPGREE